MAEMFESLLNEMKDAEKNFPEDLKEADSLGKGPDKAPEMKGKSPDLANVNEEDGDMAGDEEMDAYDRPNFPNPSDEEMDEGNPNDAMDRMDGLVDQRAVEAAGLAMTQVVGPLLKDGFEIEDVVKFLTAMAQEAAENAAGERSLDYPEEELSDKDECNEPPMRR